MSFNFVLENFKLGGEGSGVFNFYKRSFILGAGGAPTPTWQDIIISGNTALTLVNAKADGLNYVKLFGGGENRIMLPAGYTQYTYIRNGQGATINTGWRPTVDDVVFDIRFYCNSTGSMYLWQSRDGSSGNILGLGGSQSGSTISLYGGGGSTPITSSISRTIGNIYHIIATLKNGNATLYVKDETAGVEDTQTGTYTFGANSTKFYFFGNANQYATNGYRIYSAKCWYQGRLIQNWVFAQDEDEQSGIYNLVDGTFITNSNTWVMGEEINNPSPDYPMDIVCNNGILKANAQKQIYADGTTETVNIHNKNIWDNSKISISGVGYTITETDYGFIATAGASTGNSSRAVVYLDVDFFKANTTYVISGIDGYKSLYVGRTVDGANDNGYYKNGGSGRYFTISDIAEGQTRFIISIYLGTKEKGFEFDFSHIQIEEGTTSTGYEIPFDGGTATAEMLLKVGAYQDIQSVLDGEVTRNVGILVLDGTEDWTTSSWQTTGNYAYLHRIAGGHVIDTTEVTTVDCITSHAQAVNRTTALVYGNNNIAYYGGGSIVLSQAPYILFRTSMDLTAWKKFLADQYNAGTPVIVVYPLATPTTETVEGQTLTTQRGTNVIEITQASIDGLPLEVSYKAGVTVTVEEIENANLDDSVTVTIGE